MHCLERRNLGLPHRGRVFWSATDETWLWRYLVGDYPWFYPFWQQAMYWVRQGKLLGAKRYRIAVERDRYSMGDKVQVFVTAYDEKFQKLELPRLDKDTKAKVYVEPPEGKRELVEVKKDKERHGYYTGEFQPTQVGNYKIWVGEDEDEASRAEGKFNVEIPTREEDEPILNQHMMERIAEASHQAKKSGRQYYRIDQVGDLAKDVKASEHIMRKPHQPDDLWDSPLVWILFALLITTEWVLRKVWRML